MMASVRRDAKKRLVQESIRVETKLALLKKEIPIAS
jgi:hypothetical protein